ncbi:fibronectin type III-like domain-contianing protein [Streptomyces sp. NPDC005548]|uniref:fibronectin type III-like domain-contianing protein n=1 Tax=Streptomyces sp. NPDC005548 TaxID=3364724 RepID=UPI003690B91F
MVRGEGHHAAVRLRLRPVVHVPLLPGPECEDHEAGDRGQLRGHRHRPACRNRHRPGLRDPGKRLAAFRQVELRPGQHKRIKVTIARTASDHPLSIWDTHKDAWVTPSGTYTVEAGSSSADLLLKKSVTFRQPPLGPWI